VETKKSDPHAPDADGAEAAPSAVQVDKVRDLIHVLTNAIQAARLYPVDHKSAVRFISNLHERMSAYLDEHWKLEIGIEEQAFTFAGIRVHEESQAAKSLPFFFFKDGMQAISFYKGIEREELKGLLETIRTVSALPADEGDIVTALWEKDFANIRYLAPDDYLETKIGQGRPPLEWQVDREAMEKGRIDLSPEDLEAVRARIFAMERSEGKTAETLEVAQDDGLGSLVPPSDEIEAREIEAMLAASRRISPQDEHLSLVIEVIYLEDREDQFSALGDLILRTQRELLARGDFVRASRLFRSLLELGSVLAGVNADKAAMLAGAIGEITSPGMLAELEESVRERRDGDEALFRYLGLIGPSAARLVGDLFERANTKAMRETALETLKKIGREDIGALMLLPQESRPGLTGEIIAIVSGSRDKRVIPFLAGFLSHGSVPVRIEAVRALARADEEAAGTILLGFAADQEEAVRIEALAGLRPGADRKIIRRVLELSGGESGLKKKSAAERRAFLAALGRSRSEDACAWLHRLISRRSYLPGRKHTELCLGAVSALAMMPLPEARRALEEGARKRRGRVREACRKALENRPEPATAAPSEKTGQEP
jgi:HEAT repeat protein